jgi:hypothetical protein
MSLPIAATGPLNVLTKPILMVFCWATTAGAAANAAIAATAQPASKVRFIGLNLRKRKLGQA